MKHSISIVTLCCILGIACSAKAQGFSISVSNVEQLPGGKLRIEGRMSGSNMHPEGQLWVENTLSANIEFMTSDESIWPGIGGPWNLSHAAEGWYQSGKRVPDETVDGKGVGGGQIAGFNVEDEDEGKEFLFSSLVNIPTNATSARVTGELFHVLNGPPWNWPARIMWRKSAASVSIIPWDMPGKDGADGNGNDAGTGGDSDTSQSDNVSSNAPQVVSFSLKDTAGFVNNTAAARRLRAEVAVSDADADLSKVVFIDEAGKVQTKEISGNQTSVFFDFTPTDGGNSLQVEVFDTQGHKSVRKKSLLLP